MANYYHSSGKVQKMAQKKLMRLLAEPERAAQEEAFREKYRDATDEELYAYVKSQKQKPDTRLKPGNVIGYSYLTQRLGNWKSILAHVDKLPGRETSERSTDYEKM